MSDWNSTWSGPVCFRGTGMQRVSVNPWRGRRLADLVDKRGHSPDQKGNDL